MPHRRPYDVHTVQALLEPGRSVASHQELKEAGVPTSTITYRIRPDGPWQRVLPGVVAGHRGVLTPLERRLAALRYAGAGAQLTGIDALVEHGLPAARRLAGGPVHVTVPHANRRTSHGFAVLTAARPRSTRWSDGVSRAPPPRWRWSRHAAGSSGSMTSAR